MSRSSPAISTRICCWTANSTRSWGDSSSTISTIGSPLLRQLLEYVRPGGLVVFQEIVQDGSYAAFPTSPTWERLRGWPVELIARSGRNPLGGLAIHRTFLAAGLPAPEMRAHAAIINSPESLHLSLLLESVRSGRQRLLEFGVATAEELDIDAVEHQVRAEFAANQTAALGRLTVDAWTHKP